MCEVIVVTSGKGGVVTTAMLHMKDQGKIQNLRLQMGILLIRAKHTEDILRCGKLFLRIVNIKALAAYIVIVSLISINR